MIKPVQVNKVKKKNICGYILMFKKISWFSEFENWGRFEKFQYYQN
jgi:hypothetical protein